jgi:hypothetical protein
LQLGQTDKLGKTSLFAPRLLLLLDLVCFFFGKAVIGVILQVKVQKFKAQNV